MTRTRPWRHTSGIAALEFALCAPVVLTMLAGLSDLGMAARSKAQLASGVANAATYAFLTQGAATASTLTAIVGSASGLSGTLTVAPPSTSGPSCSSGYPAKLTRASGSTCPDGSPAGIYVTITASYVYTPVSPGYTFAADTTLTETATVRVQ